MTDRPSSRHAPGWPEGTLLTARVRRDIADLNRLFLDRAMHPAYGLDPWFQLPLPAIERLRQADGEALGRAACCPFALFEIALPPLDDPEPWLGDAIADGPGGRPAEPVDRETRRAFGLAALGLVRTLTEGVPLAPRIAFGLRAGTEARVASLSLSDSYRVAAWPGLIRPRRSLHERYWNLLVELVASEDTAHWAYAAGVCLLVQWDWRPPATAVGVRPPVRPRHRRGSRDDPGVPC